MTIIKDMKEKQVVKFAKHMGCPKCRFLDMSISSSEYKNDIKAIYLEDYTPDDFLELGVSGTPVMAVVEDGKIIKRDATVITGEQLAEFMNAV